jgi:signal transduction histidine kinase
MKWLDFKQYKATYTGFLALNIPAIVLTQILLGIFNNTSILVISAIPIILSGWLFGRRFAWYSALILFTGNGLHFHVRHMDEFSAPGSMFLGAFSYTIYASIGTALRFVRDLYTKIHQLNEELKEAQKELVEKAHQAGMADIAVGTIHNVGNILNSVKASVEAMEGILSVSPLEGLTQANKLLGMHVDRLDDFILVDPRGKKLLQYYLKIEEPLQGTFDQLGQNVKRAMEKVNAINDVIAAQQTYAGVGGLSEKVRLADILEDALTMQSGSLDHHKIKVTRDYADVPEIFVHKTKLVHILVNLINNAKDAMVDTPTGNRVLALSIYQEGERIVIHVKDTGSGIAAENITRIFSQGFTTKKGGHGFGLHSCANYMKEMGGEIRAESDGKGKGAAFVLTFHNGAVYLHEKF